MMEDNVQVCAILRNFQSDSEYLSFGDGEDGFWIQKLNEEDKKDLFKKEIRFPNSPWDNYLVGRHYYIGRGKSATVLRDNATWHFFPLFRALKLFRTGDVVMPMAFFSWKGKHHSKQLHGESYSFGIGLKGNPYIFNKSEVKAFSDFSAELDKYLRGKNFALIPYHKP